MTRFLVPALAAVSLAAFVTPASAETYTAYVEHADLDLNAASGRQALMDRVDTAVDEVCGPAEVRVILLSASRAQCQTDAANMAFEQVARLVANVRVIAAIRDEYFRERRRNG